MVDISDMGFTYRLIGLQQADRNQQTITVDYCPLRTISKSSNDSFIIVDALKGRCSYTLGQIPTGIYEKVETLGKIITPLLPVHNMPSGNQDPLSLQPTILEILYEHNYPKNISIISHTGNKQFIGNRMLTVRYSLQNIGSDEIKINPSSLSDSQRLIVTNLASWVKDRAWEHLRERIMQKSGQNVSKSSRFKVFISYKRNSSSDSVAEAIASRLGQIGIDVWLDKWEIKAGESVTGKIGEGFKDTCACLIFLTASYSDSAWCTKEMNTALNKAIEEKMLIIPCLIESCNKPELLKDLRHVDFINCDDAKFEVNLRLITDSIYKVDYNPYRQLSSQ
jgi:hypothetical protein